MSEWIDKLASMEAGISWLMCFVQSSREDLEMNGDDRTADSSER